MWSMSVNDSLVAWASERADVLLSPLGNRWLHVQGVVKCASWVGQTFDEGDRLLLLTAAYLHDIGYAPSWRVTGFHPLDGALYVRSFGYERASKRTCAAVISNYESFLVSIQLLPMR